ncbi:hypothetical protein B0H10DRAFT_2032630 [Mycena sp. CBHHK59/15]|nr:hypothetical protein B0H10DRAFT_2032630 [Mycena sp. CBHHK59/15]
MLERYPELALEILDQLALPLAFHTTDPPNLATLASCSLVCKHWSAHSQRLLFRRVSIPAPGIIFYLRPIPEIVRFPSRINRMVSFAAAITADTEKARWLRENVLSIILRPFPSSTAHDLAALLMNLPNLRELDITGTSCVFNDAELAQFRESGPRITSLIIDSDFSGPIPMMGMPAWPCILEFIAVIPTLRMLEITSNNVLQLPLFDLPRGLGLLSVKLNSSRVLDASACVASLLKDEPNHLQIFYQTKSAEQVDLREILRVHGDHLRSLAVQWGPRDPDVLSLCTRLERFEIATFPSNELLDAIPRTIKALAIQGAPWDPPNSASNRHPRVPLGPPASIEHFIEQLDTFPVLKIFTWLGSSNSPRLATLKEYCESRNIELRVPPKNSVSGPLGACCKISILDLFCS